MQGRQATKGLGQQGGREGGREGGRGRDRTLFLSCSLPSSRSVSAELSLSLSLSQFLSCTPPISFFSLALSRATPSPSPSLPLSVSLLIPPLSPSLSPPLPSSTPRLSRPQAIPPFLGTGSHDILDICDRRQGLVHGAHHPPADVHVLLPLCRIVPFWLQLVLCLCRAPGWGLVAGDGGRGRLLCLRAGVALTDAGGGWGGLAWGGLRGLG